MFFTMLKYFFICLSFFLSSCSTRKVLSENDLIYQSTPKNIEKFGTFIWEKNKNDSIIFNKKNIALIKKKKSIYYKSLFKYTYFFTKPKLKVKNISFTEKSKILAHLLYFIIQIDFNSNVIESTIYCDEDLHYYTEFEKYNYYNLLELKKDYQKLFELCKPIKKIKTPSSKIILRNEY